MIIKGNLPVNRNSISPLKMAGNNKMGNIVKSMYTTNNNLSANAIA